MKKFVLMLILAVGSIPLMAIGGNVDLENITTSKGKLVTDKYHVAVFHHKHHHKKKVKK